MGTRGLIDRMPPFLRGTAGFLVGAVVFALAYTQAPLYYSNQNQYFLHGLAEAGVGLLSDDWLASQTADPTPAFSGAVTFTDRYLSADLFYVFYALLMGLYLLGMIGIFTAVAGPRTSAAAGLLFVALLLLVHSAVVRWLSWRVLDNDYPWFLQSGLAGQYLLGPVFQPSAFGVLLVVSVACFANGRPLLAAICAGAAAAIHATYLPGAAMLTIAYLVILSWERHWRDAFLTGALALAVVMPMVIYSALVFGPSSADEFARAQGILAHLRVPHHTEPRLWLDTTAIAQIVWVGLALGLLWVSTRLRGAAVGHGSEPSRSDLSATTPPARRLFAALGLVALLTLALSLVQIVTNSDTLALLFPWRTSAFLVPIATSVVLARFVRALASWFDASVGRRQVVTAASAALVAALAAGGVWIIRSSAGYATAADELPLLEYVRTHKQEGDRYLVPVVLPTAPPPPPASIDFKPAPPAATRPSMPFDLQRFRLYTGAPIHVDFKAIPYKDREVLDWDRRLRWVHDFYPRLQEETLGGLGDELTQRGVTHVIVRTGQEVRCRELEKLFQGGAYTVYRVR